MHVLCGRRAVLAAWLVAAGAASAGEPEAARLLEGVARIAAPGVPGPLCVFGPAAFPVVGGGSEGGSREAVVAAARWGKGRAVAFGHDGYFDPKTLDVADTGRLMLNAVRWGGGGERPRVAVLRYGGLRDFLQRADLPVDLLDGPAWRDGLAACQVLCVNPVHFKDDADRAAVAAFVEGGGGVIAVGLGWGWQQLNAGKSLRTDHPASRLLAPAGIAWADGTLSHTAEEGYAAGDVPPALLHASRALDALLALDAKKSPLGEKDAAQALLAVTRAARTLPPDDRLLLPRLRRVREDHAGAAVPTPEKPLKRSDVLGRLLVTVDLEEADRLPPERVQAHPSAAAFPGPVPADAPRVARVLEVDTAVPDWHGTGLYAPPGGVVTVTVPEGAGGKGLQVRIGAHADGLWHLDAWQRCPDVCRRAPIAGPATRVASPFGGLVYLEVPRGCALGKVRATIRGAVEAPYFLLGETQPEAWKKSIRGRPAPWAELATGKVVLTLPSKAVRALEDPEDLLRFWDRVMDCCAELAARPLERERPERYVADVQISAGYMHSGYPVMVLLDMPEVMVDKARMMKNGHGGVWGLWHEMGHNHQAGDWTFDGTGEVTVNLFTLYVFDEACGLPRTAFGHLLGEARAKKVRAYRATGPDFARWKADPFLALLMYMQMQEAFGWDPFKKVFAEYRGLAAAERPKTDDAKRDQWLVRFSRTVGRNLGPFFEAWGVPTSPQARAQVAGLPAWMPEGFPPKDPAGGP